MTKDFEVTVKVRNNRFLAKMREVGIDNMSELARRMGRSPGMIHTIASMSKSAQTLNQQWRSAVKEVADFLGCMPEDIIPESVRTEALATNTSTFLIDGSEVSALIGNLTHMALPADAHLDGEELKEEIRNALTKLSPRQERVVRKRFGLGCEEQTYEEIGQEFGVSRERIRQIEKKALRKLRGPRATQSTLWPFVELDQ